MFMKNANSALLSWIGDADLIEYSHTLPVEKRRQLILAIPDKKNQKRLADKINGKFAASAKSPLVTIFRHYGQRISTVYLLTDRIHTFLKSGRSFESFLLKSCPSFSGKIEFINCEERLPRTTDMSIVYQITQEVITKAKSTHQELYCNLSSGVPVATAATIMLATAYFNNYHLLQTFNDRIDEESLPESFSALIQKRALNTGRAALPNRIVGNSKFIEGIRRITSRIAPYGYNMLILGQSGTGKSTIAGKIHAMSGRKGKLVEVNCGSLAPTLLGSRLFGHKKGAFTDAKTDRAGAFAEADGGTLFLDEIADCTPEMQTTLLHVLQPHDNTKPTLRRFRPLGGNEDIASDVRVITATNKPIRSLVQQGKFREDLFYRISTTTLHMPSLAQRQEDIEEIAKSCLDEINACNRCVAGYEPKSLSRDAIGLIKSYSWPGNIRELQSVLQESAIMTDGDSITAGDIRLPATQADNELPSPEMFSIEAIKTDLERRYINAAIDVAGGNKAQASRLLGMKSPQNLESRIKALNRNLGA